MLIGNNGVEYSPSNRQKLGMTASNWADDFKNTFESKPSILKDKQVLSAWFFNALMKGYDTKVKEISEKT